MGGSGSGSSPRYGVVEQSFRLSLAPLLTKAREQGGGFLGVMQREGGRVCSTIDRIEVEVRVGPETGSIRLRYIAVTHDGRIVPRCDRIMLVSAPQPFGGRQWWMVCPSRRARCKAMFLPYGAVQFASRAAWGLNYACQRSSAKDRDLVRAQRIRQKLGGEWSLAEPFPDRPRYMRVARYEALRAKAGAALAAHDAASLPMIRRWLDTSRRESAGEDTRSFGNGGFAPPWRT